MIGNDIVDLDLAQKESNWKRKGFLDKIFTLKEKELIQSAVFPEIMVWNLWSRKEAAYKIYNRKTGKRGFFPMRIECDCKDENFGTVSIENFIFYTTTEITKEYLYTVATSESVTFKEVKTLESSDLIKKENGIPYRLDSLNECIPVSITHHGKYKRIITL